MQRGTVARHNTRTSHRANTKVGVCFQKRGNMPQGSLGEGLGYVNAIRRLHVTASLSGGIEGIKHNIYTRLTSHVNKFDQHYDHMQAKRTRVAARCYLIHANLYGQITYLAAYS